MMKLPATKRKCLFWFDDVSGDGYHDDLLQFDHKRINWEIIVYGHTPAIGVGLCDCLLIGIVCCRTHSKENCFSLLRNKSSKILMIVMMAFCMVIGMVTFMSMYGLASSYYANGLGGNHCLEATSPFSLKFRVCLPLQLLIVGPTVRFLFGRLKAKRVNESLSAV